MSAGAGAAGLRDSQRVGGGIPGLRDRGSAQALSPLCLRVLLSGGSGDWIQEFAAPRGVQKGARVSGFSRPFLLTQLFHRGEGELSARRYRSVT